MKTLSPPPAGLSDAVVRRIFGKALLTRFVEEALLDLFGQGKLYGTVHTCIGQELSGAVLTEFLRPGDTIFSNHRCHGHFLSRHGDAAGLIAELMGRRTGVSGGMGGSQHLCRDGFYSNGIQGGIVPVAAGLALGHKLRGRGDVSVVFIGDGTLGEGVVYETMNIASKWELPLLVVLEDNKFAQSTAQHETLAGDIDARAAAFSIATATATTRDWQRLHDVAGRLVAGMRDDSRPRFLRIETYRLKAHSKGDDTRPRSEVEPHERVDPVNVFLAGLTAEDAGWVESIRAEVRDAIALAEAAPPAVLPPAEPPPDAVEWTPATLPEKTRVVTALNRCFSNLMERHPEIVMLGEDILSPYGGAFKVTKGLSDAHPDRVRNTPISEAAIVGIGTGLGLTEFRPLVEIMFGDFVGLAFDQIVNHAAKFRQMYNGQVAANVIVRTPMGGGRGYGPTHSQTLDHHFLGVPGLRVLALSAFADPARLYEPLLETATGPTLVIENKLLYGSYLAANVPQGWRLLHSSETFPTAWLVPESDEVDVTLLGYGGTAELLLEASQVLFDRHDIVAQVLCVMQIYPFDVEPLRGPLAAAGRLLVVEEGQGFSGFGAEVVTQLAERGGLDGLAVRRLHPPAHCIPSSGPLEKEMLPSVAGIVRTVLEMTHA
jgi:2-oxoisovalerate dehydrogenase E1 component